MSISDRYLRAVLNNMPENPDNLDKLKSLEHFFMDIASHYEKPNKGYQVGILGKDYYELYVNVNNMTISDEFYEIYEIKSRNQVNYKIFNLEHGGQVVQTAIIKTLLEADENMDFYAIAAKMQENLKTADAIVDEFSIKELHDGEITNERIRASKGELTQDAIEVITISDMVASFYKEIVPIIKEIGFERCAQSLIEEQIRNLIERYATNMHFGNGIVFKGQVPAQLWRVMCSGLITRYKKEENGRLSPYYKQAVSETVEGKNNITFGDIHNAIDSNREKSDLEPNK